MRVRLEKARLTLGELTRGRWFKLQPDTAESWLATDGSPKSGYRDAVSGEGRLAAMSIDTPVHVSEQPSSTKWADDLEPGELFLSGSGRMAMKTKRYNSFHRWGCVDLVTGELFPLPNCPVTKLTGSAVVREESLQL